MSETISYKLPKTLDQITLGQYVAFMSAKTDLAKAAIAVGKPVKEVEGLTFHAIQTICELYEEVCNQPMAKHHGTFVVGEMRLGFIPDLHAITFREHIDMDALAQSVWPNDSEINYENLPKLMAVLFRPVAERLGNQYRIKTYDAGKMDEYMPYVLGMPMDRVNGAMVFFSTIVNELALSSRAYLAAKLTRKMEKILELELEED
jgi:hypothetical protein